MKTLKNDFKKVHVFNSICALGLALFPILPLSYAWNLPNIVLLIMFAIMGIPIFIAGLYILWFEYTYYWPHIVLTYDNETLYINKHKITIKDEIIIVANAYNHLDQLLKDCSTIIIGNQHYQVHSSKENIRNFLTTNGISYNEL